MININLIPPERRPITRSPLPYLGVAVLLVLGVFVCLASLLAGMNKVSAREETLEQVEGELEELADAVERVDNLRRDKANLSLKRKAVGRIMQDRILWAEQIYTLATLVPDNVWVSEIEEETRTKKIDIPNPQKGEKGQPPTIRRQVTIRTLKISGYAFSRTEKGVDLVGVFVRNLESSPKFTEMFTDPEPQLVSDEEFAEGVKVKQFEITCTIEAVPSGSV